MKVVLVAGFLCCALLLSSSLLDLASAAPAPEEEDVTYKPGVEALEAFCGRRCSGRCSKAGVQDRCLKYCGICCKECKCVPSGTYGNKHQCACYRDKLNAKGESKCP